MDEVLPIATITKEEVNTRRSLKQQTLKIDIVFSLLNWIKNRLKSLFSGKELICIYLNVTSLWMAMNEQSTCSFFSLDFSVLYLYLFSEVLFLKPTFNSLIEVFSFFNDPSKHLRRWKAKERNTRSFGKHQSIHFSLGNTRLSIKLKSDLQESTSVNSKIQINSDI